MRQEQELVRYETREEMTAKRTSEQLIAAL